MTRLDRWAPLVIVVGSLAAGVIAGLSGDWRHWVGLLLMVGGGLAVAYAAYVEPPLRRLGLVAALVAILGTVLLGVHIADADHSLGRAVALGAVVGISAAVAAIVLLRWRSPSRAGS